MIALGVMGLQSLLSIKARLDRMERRMSKLDSALKRQATDSEDSGRTTRRGSATRADRVSSVNTVSTYEESLCGRLPDESKHRRPRANSLRSRGVPDDDETGDAPYSQPPACRQRRSLDHLAYQEKRSSSAYSQPAACQERRSSDAALTFQRVSSENAVHSVTADEALTILNSMRTNLRCDSGTALPAQADADLSASESRGRPSKKSPKWSNPRPATLEAMTRKSPAIVSPYQAVQRMVMADQERKSKSRVKERERAAGPRSPSSPVAISR